jgi:outer membrane protein OmpA-like peptidoglycan-associated protein
MTMRSIKLTVALALCAGCSAPFTYPDLAKAKDTYAHAVKNGDPKKYPKEFDAAKKSIGAAQAAQDAQASFERGKDPSRERDLSKEALYRAEVADSATGAGAAAAAAATKEEELAALQKEWDEKGAAANDAAARAEAERAAREAEEARKRLQKFADVKEDERGTIITLAGGIPFKTGKADLQPVAVDRLKIVAEALKGTQRTVLVEGHTDSTGKPETNMKLSQARAETVRKYLIDGGIPADQIRAQGVGQDRPVADNKTSAGRAKNRRVEIILEKPKA